MASYEWSIFYLQDVYYGLGPVIPEFEDLAEKSVNIDLWGATSLNIADLYKHVSELADPYSSGGTSADNAPISLVSWSGSGAFVASGMDYWHGCLDLFLRYR